MSSKVQSLTFFSIHTPASLLPRAKNSQHSAQWAFGHIRPLRKVPIILAENANSLEKLGARKVKNTRKRATDWTNNEKGRRNSAGSNFGGDRCVARRAAKFSIVLYFFVFQQPPLNWTHATIKYLEIKDLLSLTSSVDNMEVCNLRFTYAQRVA